MIYDKIFATTVLAASFVPGLAGAEENYRKWQLDRLFAPTAQQLMREKSGRVAIYDGLLDTEVEQVMESQFDRLASMMFVRTIVTDKVGTPLTDGQGGGYVTEDDDCD